MVSKKVLGRRSAPRRKTGSKLLTDEEAKNVLREHLDAARAGATELDLSALNLSQVPEELATFTWITSLDLSANELTALPNSLASLTRLESLDVSHNSLRALPGSLGSLTRLQALRMWNCALPSLPDGLGDLANLKLLDVRNNELKSIPNGISRLRKLTKLYVRGNELVSIPEELDCLRDLLDLDVSDNRLAALPNNFANFSKLKRLVLAANQIRELPDSLEGLSALRILLLGGNAIQALPEWIGNLTELRTLSLGGNPLRTLPTSIGKLHRLERLEVIGTVAVYDWESDSRGWQPSETAEPPYTLQSLPESLKQLTSLESLFLHDQPTLDLPDEVLGGNYFGPMWSPKAPPATILDYYFKLREGSRPLNEVRLLLVGRGAAGKTSIVRQLVHNTFNPKQRETQGIKIESWELGPKKAPVRAHVWDFAGQVITHATHQFFLSHRSVYVLVLTGREDSETTDAEYWLRLVRAFGSEAESGKTSPVIIALNKCKSSPCKLDRNALVEKYPFIVGFVETDCKSGFGIRKLKALLTKVVADLPSVREPFPAAWFAIKERLSKMKQDYVSYAQFRQQCAELGEQHPGRQGSLGRVLHQLGVALNYADDERLREATVLNPHWVTRGIYTLLRDAAHDGGTMDWRDVERALPKEKPEMRRYLVELMRRFELAFPLSEDGERWLVPQRLPPSQPTLSGDWAGAEVTRLRYTYGALPEGLIPRFITRTYPLSEDQARWVNGVVLQMDGARALVRADPSERQINVSVSGPVDDRRRLTGLVREELRRVHAGIRGLDPFEELELEEQQGIWLRLATLEADERKQQSSAAPTRGGTIAVDNTSELNRVSAAAARNPMTRKLRVFISYSNKDAKQFDELKVRLTPMLSEGLVEQWSDRCLVAGAEWDKTIRSELEQADVILLLWSPQFEATDYIQSVELARARARAGEGKAVVVPIILEQCAWKQHELSKYQILPAKGPPVRDVKPQRKAWSAIAVSLRELFEKLSARVA